MHNSYLLFGGIIFGKIQPVGYDTEWDATYASVVQKEGNVCRTQAYTFNVWA